MRRRQRHAEQIEVCCEVVVKWKYGHPVSGSQQKWLAIYRVGLVVRIRDRDRTERMLAKHKIGRTGQEGRQCRSVSLLCFPKYGPRQSRTNTVESEFCWREKKGDGLPFRTKTRMSSCCVTGTSIAQVSMLLCLVSNYVDPLLWIHSIVAVSWVICG